MIKILCDKCGAEIAEGKAQTNYINVHEHQDNHTYSYKYEICDKCLRELNAWIKEASHE